MRFLMLLLLPLLAYAEPFPLTFTWVDKSNNETGFRFYMRVGTGIWNPLPDSIGPNLETWSYSPEVTGGEHMEFYVVSFNAEGESAASNTVAVDVQGWIIWKPGDGGIYAYSPKFGWVWTDTKSLPYVYLFSVGKWLPINFEAMTP